MNRRSLIARAVLTLGILSFVAYLWIFFDYQGSRPHRPQPEAGRVYRSNNHGSIVYLTAEEATRLGLLMVAFGLSIVVVLAVRPKDKQGIRPISNKGKAMVAGATAFYLAFIKFCGPAIAKFAVSHGLVVSW